ncbi:hypothetical protein RRG08_048422 [Elysia crispata]|uniref:Uncharacterized protein n=1 Tax=Elysia crispata TaxID=231223 RepID=A0AAE1B9K1_9GAST|nr:hypothetical protein RRG08_048422 [Elysia crispata]
MEITGKINSTTTEQKEQEQQNPSLGHKHRLQQVCRHKRGALRLIMYTPAARPLPVNSGADVKIFSNRRTGPSFVLT